MLNHKVQAEQLKKHMSSSKTALILAHVNPDGDTLGAVCAWIPVLEKNNIETTAFCISPIPEYLRALPHSHRITSDTTVLEKKYDLIIANDLANLDRLGVDATRLRRDGTTLVNIDHHPTNPNFGHINIVIENASSTSEILARLFHHWNEPISRDMAEALLNGVVTDTDNLINPATNYTSFTTAAKLIEAGADLHTIVSRTLRNKSLAHLQLWGLVLSRIKFNKRFRAVMTYVTPDDFAQSGSDEEAIEGIANYLTLIPDINMALVLKVRPDGYIKGSLRSVKDSIDVSKIAALFGGGGHRKASGFLTKAILNVDGDRWTIT